MGLWELREFLKERNGDNLALQGLTDPFSDAIRFTQDGEVCHDGEPSENCLSVAEELFETLSATASAPAQEYFESLRTVDSVDVTPAGKSGEIERLTFQAMTVMKAAYKKSPLRRVLSGGDLP